MQQYRRRHIIGHNARHPRRPSKQPDQLAPALHVTHQLLLQIEQVQVALVRFGHLLDLHAQIQPRSQIVLRLAGADKQNGRRAAIVDCGGALFSLFETENVRDSFDGTGVGCLAEDDFVVGTGIDRGSNEFLGLVTI